MHFSVFVRAVSRQLPSPMVYGALPSTQLIAASRFEDALARSGEEIAAMPHEPEALFNRGQALAGLGRLEEAVRDYEAALRLDFATSALDPATVDDELFSALRDIAL